MSLSNNNKIFHVTQIAVIAAVMAVLSFIRIPIGPVPIVLENFGVMLAALLLGAKRGTISVIIFILIRILGIGGPSGMALLFSPVSGYVYGWLLMPVFINLLIKLFHAYHWGSVFLIVVLVGVILDDFICGSIGLVTFNHLSILAAFIYNGTFVIGDIAKSAVAASLYVQIMKSSYFRQLLK